MNVFFFRSIDATAESPSLGRLINHSLNGNLETRILDDHGVPRLCFFAKRDINIGEQLTYNYGEDRRNVLKALPWLKGTIGEWCTLLLRFLPPGKRL